MILFSATIENFEIVPYTRMTQKSKYLDPRALKYLASQEALAFEFKKSWNGKDAIDYPVEISFSVHVPHRRGDCSNFLKAIEDALQYAGIISNDNIIEGIGRSNLFRDGKKRVVVNLRRL